MSEGKITATELLSDLPELLELGRTVQAAVASMPKDGSAVALSGVVVAVLPKLAALVDRLREQAKS